VVAPIFNPRNLGSRSRWICEFEASLVLSELQDNHRPCLEKPRKKGKKKKKKRQGLCLLPLQGLLAQRCSKDRREAAMHPENG